MKAIAPVATQSVTRERRREVASMDMCPNGFEW
jgi:hypothetical protein